MRKRGTEPYLAHNTCPDLIRDADYRYSRHVIEVMRIRFGMHKQGNVDFLMTKRKGISDAAVQWSHVPMLCCAVHVLA